MKVVCDTNVLIAGLVADGLCGDIVKRRLRKHVLFTSAALLEELDEKLRNKFQVNPSDVPFIQSYRECVKRYTGGATSQKYLPRSR